MTVSEQAIVEQMRLDPCPFCGGTDIFTERSDFSSSYAVCNQCVARGPTLYQESDDEEQPGEAAAIRAWNTRVPALPVAVKDEARSRAGFEMTLAERLKSMRDSLPEGVWEVWTSNSYRRISVPWGVDGGVLCGTIQRSDGHPDLSMTEDQLQNLVGIINAIPEILAALSAGGVAPVGEERAETGWVIEHASSSPAQPVYWTGQWGRWAADHLHACRFARREDALKVSLAVGDTPHDPPHRVAEHKWINP